MANWKGGFDRSFSAAEFRDYVLSLKWGSWKPQIVTVHNTGAPNLAQWRATPGGEAQRLKNLEHYYKNQNGWSSGPHLFIGERIWLGTPLTVTGTHTPSWNGIAIGMEIAGNYDVDPFEGVIRENAIAALAALHEALKLDPETMRFHKEDAKTTHKHCPGKNIVKADLIKAVKAKMGSPAQAPVKAAPITVVDHDTHTVQPGETLFGIAKRYGKILLDLLTFNGGSSAIKPGQVIALKPGARELSYDGECFIAREEGVVLTVYLDGTVPAVGMGHNDPKMTLGDTITLEAALKLFEADAVKFTAGAMKALTKPAAKHELDAMVSLAYNIGLANFAKSSVAVNFNAGDKAKAAESFLLWHKAGGVANVLLGRRQRERAMFLNADYGDLSTVPVWTGNPRTTKPVWQPLP